MSEQLQAWIKAVSDPGQSPWTEEVASQVDPAPLSREAEMVDPTRGLLEQEGGMGHTFRGPRDEQGLFHGGGVLQFDNGDSVICDFVHGIRNGDAVIMSPRNNIARLCGVYVDGLLQGPGTLIDKSTSVTEFVFKDSVAHGVARTIEMRKFREFRRQMTFIGRFQSGRPRGPCWKYMEGGGFLFGHVDDQGEFSGNQIAYIYPDMATAWLGCFKKGVMISAKVTKVIGVKVVDHILVPDFATPTGLAVGKSKSTQTSMGQHLLVPDPYETSQVVCHESGIAEAGEGLFAAKDIEAGDIVAFYNGVRIPFRLGGPKEEWSTSGYKIFVNADFISGERMNIPDDYVSLNKYCATLGHKMNHAFNSNCSEWFCDHPRFGVIPCLRAKVKISKGQELTLDYEYDPYNCPEWFKLALTSFVEASDEDALANLNPKYLPFIKNECNVTFPPYFFHSIQSMDFCNE